MKKMLKNDLKEKIKIMFQERKEDNISDKKDFKNKIIKNKDKEQKECDLKKAKKYNEMKILYRVKNEDKRIRLFGRDFISNNKNLCKIVYDEKENE